MDEKGFPGDPGHEAGNQPMRHLKGGCSGVHTQAPMSGTNDGKSQGQATDTTGNIAGWDNTALNHSTGGSRGVGGNDTRSKST